MSGPTVPITPLPPGGLNITITTALFNVGPGSNPAAYMPIVPNPGGPIAAPDATKGNVAGVWGYVGGTLEAPSQTSQPPITCAVYGQGGVVGVKGFSLPGIPIEDKDASGDGVIGFGSANGVHGIATNGIGVSGSSTKADGVLGNGYHGVHGQSASPGGAGVWGEDTGSGVGVSGSSAKSKGLSGQTTSGVAVYGKSLGSGLAGQFEGNVKINGTATVAVDVVLSGADCAEQFDTVGAQHIEPGTVVVIDEEGALRESLEAYDKKVAGVVSGGGDYRPAIVLDKRALGEERTAVALVGKVSCKVDAQYAPINVGDLLTTSPTPGHAMKAAKRGRAFGAVIGKALRRLDKGQGLIPILIALQ